MIERLVISLLVAGFTIGTITHTLLVINVGWIVFDDAPVWMNVYWTALTVLDPLAAILLIWRRQTGLILAATIIVSDVAINSHALYGLGLPLPFAGLQFQTLFCGFLLGSIGFLAVSRESDDVKEERLYARKP